MSIPASRSSYDAIPDFGLLYDAVPAYVARSDVSFYVEEAARVGGTVLELGCGTGRILLPLARSGRLVTGLDGSEQMLARCAAKVLDEVAPVQARITLHHHDARSFQLGAMYDLVIAPFRIVQHLTTIDDQLRLLDAVAAHLAPGGRFLFDVFNPHFAKLAAASGEEQEDTPELALPDGRTLRRTFRVTRVRWVEQVSEVELIYYVSAAPGAAAHRYVQSFDMRWYVRAELVHLLARAGFRVEEIHGNFDYSPLTDDSPEQVVRAVRI
jgi:SAM-dependent methyltransferase